MLTAGKFLAGSLALGATTVLGSALIQYSGNNTLNFQGPQATAILAESACQRLDSIYYAISTEVSPYIQTFPARFNESVRSNAITARLQFEGMRNGVVARFSFHAWPPATKTDLLQASIEKAGPQTRALGARIPMAKSVQDNVNRLVEIKPAFNLSPYGF